MCPCRLADFTGTFVGSLRVLRAFQILSSPQGPSSELPAESAGVLTSPDFSEIITQNLLQYGRHIVVSQLLTKTQKQLIVNVQNNGFIKKLLEL